MADETLEGKTAFKNYACDPGVKVKAYHADKENQVAFMWRVLLCVTFC
jgi:hypothetical protein